MQKRSWAGFSPGFLCAPWGREQQPIVLLDCFIPSQGLQKLWIGDLEESEDLGAQLEEVLLAGTPACRAVVAGRWEEGGVSVPLSLQEPCLSERPCLGLMLCS